MSGSGGRGAARSGASCRRVTPRAEVDEIIAGAEMDEEEQIMHLSLERGSSEVDIDRVARLREKNKQRLVALELKLRESQGESHVRDDNDDDDKNPDRGNSPQHEESSSPKRSYVPNNYKDDSSPDVSKSKSRSASFGRAPIDSKEPNEPPRVTARIPSGLPPRAPRSAERLRHRRRAMTAMTARGRTVRTKATCRWTAGPAASPTPDTFPTPATEGPRGAPSRDSDARPRSRSAGRGTAGTAAGAAQRCRSPSASSSGSASSERARRSCGSSRR